MSGYRRKHSRHSPGSEEHDDSSDDDDASVRGRGERGSDKADGKRKSHKKHKKGKKERKDRHADEDDNHWKSRLVSGGDEGYHRRERASPVHRTRDEPSRNRSPGGTSSKHSRDGYRSTRDRPQHPDSTTGPSRHSSDDRKGRRHDRRTEYEAPSDEARQRRATGRSDEGSDSANNRSRYEARHKRQQHREPGSPYAARDIGRHQKGEHSRPNSLGTESNGLPNKHRLHQGKSHRLAAGSGDGLLRRGSPAHRTRDRSRSAPRRRRSRETHSSSSGSEAEQHGRPRMIKVERQSSSQQRTTASHPTANHQPSTSREPTGGSRHRPPRGTVPKKVDNDNGTQYEWGAKRSAVAKPEETGGGSRDERRACKDKPPNADDEPADEVEKQKPNFALSGKLTEEANKVNGVVINYAEPPGACKPKRRWRLYPMKGDQIMPTLYIHRQSCYLIGRDRKVCDLPIDHPSCSKQHAVLQYRLVPQERPDGTTRRIVRPYIIDLGSSNGTFVNYKKIEPKRYLELLEKDVLSFGFSSREYVLLEENSKDDGNGEG
uniref:Putative serine/threonine-protein kinase ddb g0280133 isoform x1 n=1 Tax=Anopheles triannulatus TaxID=58253 RepID=A0A2M4AL15_9DIPT